MADGLEDRAGRDDTELRCFFCFKNIHDHCLTTTEAMTCLERLPTRDSAEGVGEASIPTYGNLPWDQLGRDVMEAVMGSRVDYKFPNDMYPGHDIAHINFNSLARIIDKYRLAPPKPAPDAMREALKPFADIAQFIVEAHRDTRPFIFGVDTIIAQRLTMGHFRNARIAYLSVPAPSASIHDAHDDIARGISRGEDEAGSPADGARILRLEQTIRDSIEALERNSTSAPVVECLKAALLAPPCAGAAEPDAWADNQGIERPIDATAMKMLKQNPTTEIYWSRFNIPLYAAPPVRGDREAIARIIAGDIFGSPDSSVGPATQAARKDALVKADAILSLPVQPAPDREAITRLIYEADSPSDPKDAWKEAQRITDVILSILI